MEALIMAGYAESRRLQLGPTNRRAGLFRPVLSLSLSGAMLCLSQAQNVRGIFYYC